MDGRRYERQREISRLSLLARKNVHMSFELCFEPRVQRSCVHYCALSSKVMHMLLRSEFKGHVYVIMRKEGEPGYEARERYMYLDGEGEAHPEGEIETER